MRLAVLLLAAMAAGADDAPRIVYSKSFPGSTPPFVEITVAKDGQAVYKESADDEQPLRFQLKAPEIEAIFALAARLDHFQRPLESGLKVANMGMKTFRWEEGPKRHEVKFNFSQDPDALALTEWFERITETEQHYIRVERSVRFDKLGVNKVLLQLQASMERNRLIAADQFLPWLDRVSKNASFLNMARERAAAMAEIIRAPEPKSSQ